MTNGEAAQARLIAALAAPLTNGPVEIVALETAGAAIRRGAIFDRAGRQIGGIENFQLDFVRFAPAAPVETLRRQQRAGDLPISVETAPEWRLIAHDAPEIAYSVPPIGLDTPEIVAVEGTGATIRFEASGEIEIGFHAHPWSGVVEVRHGGETREIDLYQPHTAAPRPERIDLGTERTRVEIALTGRRQEGALGSQCLFAGYRAPTGRQIPLRHVKTPKLRGAAFTAAFHRLLDGVPPEGLLLDLGGGNRQIDDPRYLNLDYANFDEPDLIGDATRLPLRDASVDAVYSTGVFEHIDDPLAAGAEVARVLKPGAKAVIGWAFMQPIHSEGAHFYNATPWGMQRAFAGLRLNRIWHETSFAFLVRWGAAVSDLVGRVPAQELEDVCATLARWDAMIPESHKAYMANGVWGEFEKA